MKYLPVFFCSLFSIAAHAQDMKKIDSLRNELAKAKQDTAKASLLNAIGWAFHNAVPDTTLYYVQQAYAIAKAEGDKRNMAQAKYYMGRMYYTKSNDSAALSNYDEAAALCEQTNNIGLLSTVHMQKGYTYHHLSRYADVLTEFLAALKYAEQSGSKARISDALYSLSDYYLHSESPGNAETKKAEPYLQQALVIDKELNNQSSIATDYQYLGVCYTFQGKLKDAEQNLLQALQMFAELDDNFHQATANSYLGNLYDAMGDYDKSIKYYLQSQKIFASLDTKNEMADNADNIANEYLKKKDFANALKYAKEGLTFAQQAESIRESVFLYNTMARAAAGSKDFKSAYEYSSNAFALRDSLYRKEEREKLAEMQTRFETEKKEKENQVLKALNEKANAELQRNTFLLIASLLGLLLLGSLVFAFYKNKEAKAKHIKELQKLNARLNEQKEEIARFNTILQLKALRAQMNPHFIFNCMSSIQECILTGRIDDANTYLTKLSRLLRMVLIHADDETVPLEKELEMLKLYLSLEHVRLKESFDYSINIDDEINPEEISVPTLILQPFAENAIWHGLVNKAGAKKINIDINADDETLHCTVEDNGIGRVRAAELKQGQKPHISKGMQLIEKRLSILNQHAPQSHTGFTIEDLYAAGGAAAGTRVKINLPISAS